MAGIEPESNMLEEVLVCVYGFHYVLRYSIESNIGLNSLCRFRIWIVLILPYLALMLLLFYALLMKLLWSMSLLFDAYCWLVNIWVWYEWSVDQIILVIYVIWSSVVKLFFLIFSSKLALGWDLFMIGSWFCWLLVRVKLN